jgi:hypothetical protein
MMTTTNNENNVEDVRKYLVTEAVDIKQLSQEKLTDDLKILQKFEQRAKHKTDLSKDSDDLQQTRIMKALQLTNPFKGH